MTWLDDIKVEDKVAIRTSPIGASSDEYFIGRVVKVSKTKIEVSVHNYTQTFSRSNGSAPRASKWDSPDQLVEMTAEVRQQVAARRLRASLKGQIAKLSEALPDMSLERMTELADALTKWETPHV